MNKTDTITLVLGVSYWCLHLQKLATLNVFRTCVLQSVYVVEMGVKGGQMMVVAS